MPNLILLNAPGPQGGRGPVGPKGDIGPPGPDWVINAKNYGARGDGVTDDTYAIQQTLAAAKAALVVAGQFAGCTVYFPAGVYKYNQQINVDNTANGVGNDFPAITFKGDGGQPAANFRSASTLLYTGSGTAAAISARSTTGIAFKDLSLLYSSSAFVGTLVDFGHSGAPGPVDSESPLIRDCTLGSDGGTIATATLISLDGALDGLIDQCTFWGCAVGIRGIVNGGAGYSNRHQISHGSFGNCTTAPIINPGEAWHILNNTFEGVLSPCALTDDFASPGSIFALSFVGNWLGDANATFGSTAWVHINNGELFGADFSGNVFDGIQGAASTATQKDSIKLGSCAGVSIHGNRLGTVNFGIGGAGAYSQAVSVIGNELFTGNTTGAPYWRNLTINSVVTCLANYPSGFDQGALDQLSLGGHIITYPTLGVKPSASGTASCTATVEGTAFQGSNDTSGRITLVVSGGGTTAGAQATLTFANAFDSTGTKPRVVLQAESSNAASAQAYTTPGYANFVLNTVSGLTAGTYVWSYIVLQ